MIWMLRLAFGIRKAAQALFSLAGRYPLHAALIASLCLSGWLWWGKSRAIDQRDKARADHASQIEAYREAYARTLADHAALKQAEDARLAALKDKADAVTIPNRRAALLAARDYAGRMRRQPEANSGPAGEADLPGSPADPGSVEAGRAPADMVAITRADLDACTLNTADLQTAVDWAKGLQR